MRNAVAGLFVVPLSVSLIAVAGCAQADAREATESVSESSALVGGGICPAANPGYYQRRVTAYVSYVVGGPTSPFGAYPCAGDLLGTKAITAKSVADLLRASISSGACTVDEASRSNVCGIAATERVITCLGLSGSELALVAAVGEDLDACWGIGASGFFHSSQDGVTTKIDPEPVMTTQPLSGSNGATAAAVYENSQSQTNVIKWSSTYVYSPTLAAGTPCSTTDLDSGVETDKTILATGSYKRCY